MLYVIDCSFSSAMFLPDEKSEEVRNFFKRRTPDDRIYIPILWWYETVSVLNTSLKRDRIQHTDAEETLALFGAMRFITDSEYGTQFSKELYELAQVYHVTPYDAVCLELTKRTKAKLKSHDENLLTAARKIGAI